MSTCALVDNSIAILSSRKGFDWWWDDIDPINQVEIIKEIEDLINESLQ